MRKRVRGKLYFLARDAKTRMKNYNKERSVFDPMPYAKAYNSQEQDLYNRVCKLLSNNGVVINPIKELIDNRYYNTLTLEGKQRYIFDLSEKYKEMKARFEREHDQEYAQASNI